MRRPHRTARASTPARLLTRQRIDGRRVWRTFARRNGCEIADWDRMGLPLAGPPA